MRVTMAQQPVGQGGLFVGRLQGKGGSLRWVYDCGSNQRNPLHREIRRLENKRPIDLLFISHLDSDHINGLDALLSRVSVSEVVLPYLKEIDLALTICRDNQNGRLTALFESFAADPAAWFIERDVQMVSFIRGRPDDGSSDDGADVPQERPRGDGVYGWSRSPLRVTHSGKARYFDTNGAIWSARARGRVDWLLAHMPIVRRCGGRICF